MATFVPKKKNTTFQKKKIPEVVQNINKENTLNTNFKRTKINRKLIFFIIHGLEASSFDMRHIRAAILTNISNASVCMIQKNHDLTNDCIKVQGKRMAEEILQMIESNNISGNIIPNIICKIQQNLHLLDILWED